MSITYSSLLKTTVLVLILVFFFASHFALAEFALLFYCLLFGAPRIRPLFSHVAISVSPPSQVHQVTQCDTIKKQQKKQRAHPHHIVGDGTQHNYLFSSGREFEMGVILCDGFKRVLKSVRPTAKHIKCLLISGNRLCWWWGFRGLILFCGQHRSGSFALQISMNGTYNIGALWRST